MRTTRGPGSTARRRARRSRTLLFLQPEALERRALLSTIVLFPSPDAAPTAAVRSVVHRNIAYEDSSGRVERLDVYEPSGTPPATGWPVIVAIHGGGWRRFSKEEYGPKVASQFVSHGYAVVAPDYELSAPGKPSWPANVEDVRNAVRWVRENASGYGFDTTRVAAMGESAGGQLATLLGTDPNGPLTGATAQTGPDVSAQVDAVIAFYPPTDLTRLAAESRDGGLAAGQFLGGSPAQLPALYAEASPTTHVTPGDPPMMLIQGLADTVVPHDQAQELSADLTAAGVRNQLVLVPGAQHGFEFQPQGQKLLPEILAFLSTSWNDKGSTF